MTRTQKAREALHLKREFRLYRYFPSPPLTSFEDYIIFWAIVRGGGGRDCLGLDDIVALPRPTSTLLKAAQLFRHVQKGAGPLRRLSLRPRPRWRVTFVSRGRCWLVLFLIFSALAWVSMISLYSCFPSPKAFSIHRRAKVRWAPEKLSVFCSECTGNHDESDDYCSYHQKQTKNEAASVRKSESLLYKSNLRAYTVVQLEEIFRQKRK